MFYFIKIDAIEYNLLNIHVLIVLSFAETLFLLFLVHALMIFLLLMSQFFSYLLSISSQILLNLFTYYLKLWIIQSRPVLPCDNCSVFHMGEIKNK